MQRTLRGPLILALGGKAIAWSITGNICKLMSTIREIEDAIRQLADDDLAALRAWFAEFDAAAWDRQFERDVAEGRLDALAERPFGTPGRGVAPTFEPPRNATILGLLSWPPRRGPAVGRRMLCPASTGLAASLAPSEEGRSLLVGSRRLTLSGAGSRGWPRLGLVLDRHTCGVRPDTWSL